VTAETTEPFECVARSVAVVVWKCYLQCAAHWHITRYEAIFSVANQLPVSLPGCSNRRYWR